MPPSKSSVAPQTGHGSGQSTENSWCGAGSGCSTISLSIWAFSISQRPDNQAILVCGGQERAAQGQARPGKPHGNQGLSPAQTAAHLGHADGGVLALKTYIHAEPLAAVEFIDAAS